MKEEKTYCSCSDLPHIEVGPCEELPTAEDIYLSEFLKQMPENKPTVTFEYRAPPALATIKAYPTMSGKESRRERRKRERKAKR